MRWDNLRLAEPERDGRLSVPLFEQGATVRTFDTPEFRGWLEREVEKQSNQIREAMYADPQKPFSNDDFETEVEKLREFARRRSDVVKAAVARERR